MGQAAPFPVAGSEEGAEGAVSSQEGVEKKPLKQPNKQAKEMVEEGFQAKTKGGAKSKGREGPPGHGWN